MIPLPRRTLINVARVEGVGLFTGRRVRATFHPAPAGTGITFRREDLPGSGPIAAAVVSLGAQASGVPARNTTLRVGDAEVTTVEHVLSAITGLGITDLIIELSAPELPIFDGSAAPFAGAFWTAGLRYSGEQVEPLCITREVTVTGANGSRITARPRSAAGCSYTYQLKYGPGAPLSPQSASFDTAGGDYIRDIAPARTFCTLAEAEAMKQAGLFANQSPRDMLVIGSSGPIDNVYRFDNEPARHKLLDLMGDLALVGRPLRGEIVAYKAGHALNQEMARALAAG